MTPAVRLRSFQAVGDDVSRTRDARPVITLGTSHDRVRSREPAPAVVSRFPGRTREGNLCLRTSRVERLQASPGALVR